MYISGSTVTMSSVTVSGNTASRALFFFQGGGMYITHSTVTMSSVTVSGNTAVSR